MQEWEGRGIKKLKLLIPVVSILVIGVVIFFCIKTAPVKKEGNKLLIITKDAVAKKPYNDDKEDNTWEKCTLRKWLNNEFYSSAFDSTEQSRIELANVAADKKPGYTIDPGNATQDKIFLLSINEVNKYFISDSDRINSGELYFWWLRSPGCSSKSVALVGPFGSVNCDGVDGNGFIWGVRPALWINLES